jgi:predicted GNAT family N-acyltransferase
MNQEDIICKVLVFNSDDQLKSIELRYEVLRQPLGLDFKRTDLDKESDQIHIGAFAGNKLVGVLLLKTMKDLSDDILKMRQVAVSPDFQSKGIGKKMVQFSEKWANQNGYKIIDLHARKNVVPFYEKLGYHVEGDEFLEVGIPHLRMIKQL